FWRSFIRTKRTSISERRPEPAPLQEVTGPDRIPDFGTVFWNLQLWRNCVAQQGDLGMGRTLWLWVHHRRVGGRVPLSRLWAEHVGQRHRILARCGCLLGNLWFQPPR